jgi:membrane associated rhomboid family serine protease
MIINTFVLVLVLLIGAFTKNLGWYQPVIENIAMPTKPMDLLFKPWTILTYMFVHEGFWHFVWNMVGLNIFGKIVGDLIGDRKVLPLYILGGLAGALLLVMVTPLMENLGVSTLRGASASVLALAMAGALVAPDYNIRLLIIGNVRLKYIVLFFIISDLVMSQGYENAGGHWAHLGGILMGLFYILQLRKGVDLGIPINRLVDYIAEFNEPRPQYKKHKPVMKVEHRSNKLSQTKSQKNTEAEDQYDFDETLDYILDKIKSKGYEKLTQEEKDFLHKASQK